MTERVFLGWDGVFLPRAVDWLAQRRDTLPRTLVLVPTSQSGRRLREALAQKLGGALLSPRVVTPGALLLTPAAEVASEWMERLAWMETLESIHDWTALQPLFPQEPGNPDEWSGGMAVELVGLRRALQENGLTLNAAARLLAQCPESARWETLARLERRMERTLEAWGLQSRSRVLAEGIIMPEGIEAVVLAGICEMPPLVEKTLLAWSGPVTALIAAPAGEAEAFSRLGKPLDGWTQRSLPWPEGEWGAVHVVADARQEAAEALRQVAGAQTTPDEVALGCADRETGDELVRVFTRAGWTAFHPAALPVRTGLWRWLKVWRAWVAEPTSAIMADLLAMPETEALIGGSRSLRAGQLARLRDAWMVTRAEDLPRCLERGPFHPKTDPAPAREVLQSLESLQKWRACFLDAGFENATSQLLERMPADEAEVFRDWLAASAPLIPKVRRDAGFWLSLMIEDVAAPPPQPPEGRVLDVQGWLELLYEPGRHLLLCGMHEGKVPARRTSDPFLGEKTCAMLGLSCDAERAARDAFLYHAMVEARREGGRVDVFCAKSGGAGEALLPSRLLLAADREQLPERVAFLFRRVEPPEAGLRWHADWHWKPRAVEPPSALRVTSFATWLACPLRFYLKHALRMQGTEPARIEWNFRDFGNVAHQVLERWGNDPMARALTDQTALHDWLSAALDEVVAAWFGADAPLAVRLQTESLRQRLRWFARKQAAIRSEGWETLAVESDFELAIGPSIVRGTYDRLDRHRETGALRVIDYKTGRAGDVVKAHRVRMVSSTVLPAHVPLDSPVIHETAEGVAHRWINLQLPLYVLALKDGRDSLATPCYFHLGATEADVALEAWEGFGEGDLMAAEQCAGWIAGQIAAGVFGPPTESPGHDDFEALAGGRTLGEMCEPVPCA